MPVNLKGDDMATKDFLAALPVGVHGGIGPVPGSKMPPPQLTLREENAATLARYKKFQEGRLFGPSRTTTESGTVIERSAPVPQPVPLPDPEKSAAALQDARRRLATAIERRSKREEQAGAARIACEAAARAISKISDDVHMIGDIDAAIAAWTAGRVKAGKAIDPMPRDLTERRERRGALLLELRDAEGAQAILEKDRDAAQARLAEAEDAVSEAAAAVLDAHASALAFEMVAHQRAAFRLKQRLLALADLNVGGRRYSLPAGAAQAIQRDAEPWAKTLPTARTELRSRWSAIASALTENADAPLTDG